MKKSILWGTFTITALFSHFLEASNVREAQNKKIYIETCNLHFMNDGIFVEKNNHMIQLTNICHDDSGYYLSKSHSSADWICPKCRKENPGNKEVCSRCGFPVWN